MSPGPILFALGLAGCTGLCAHASEAAGLDQPMQAISRDQQAAVLPPGESEEEPGSLPLAGRVAEVGVGERTGPEFPGPSRMPEPGPPPGLVERTLLEVNQSLGNLGQETRGVTGGAR